MTVMWHSPDITGNSNVGFSEADLDGDFDPASYDQAMAQAFDEDYYQMEEEEGEGEDGKPVFSDDNGIWSSIYSHSPQCF